METWLSIFSSLRIFLCFPDDPQHTCYKKLTLVLSSGSLARTFLLLNPVSNISAGLRLFYYLPSPLQCKKTLVILTKQRKYFFHCSTEARTLFFFFFSFYTGEKRTRYLYESKFTYPVIIRDQPDNHYESKARFKGVSQWILRIEVDQLIIIITSISFQSSPKSHIHHAFMNLR